MTQAKRWYQSKTIWANIAFGMIGIGTELAVLVDALPDDWQGAARFGITATVAVGNIILRFATDEAIA